LNVLRRHCPAVARLVTADAGSAVGAEALEEWPRQIDLTDRAEGRGEPGRIGEPQHVGQKALPCVAGGADSEERGERNRAAPAREFALHTTSLRADMRLPRCDAGTALRDGPWTRRRVL